MGYIAAYKEVEDDKQGILKIALKYDPVTKQPAITFIQRVSTPGLRRYVKSSEIPRVLNGMGIAIMTTSKGIMTGQKAKSENVGGEVLCYVY
jgi:small subunit ribosomal protein S8